MYSPDYDGVMASFGPERRVEMIMTDNDVESHLLWYNANVLPHREISEYRLSPGGRIEFTNLRILGDPDNVHICGLKSCEECAKRYAAAIPEVGARMVITDGEEKEYSLLMPREKYIWQLPNERLESLYSYKNLTQLKRMNENASRWPDWPPISDTTNVARAVAEYHKHILQHQPGNVIDARILNSAREILGILVENFGSHCKDNSKAVNTLRSQAAKVVEGVKTMKPVFEAMKLEPTEDFGYDFQHLLGEFEDEKNYSELGSALVEWAVVLQYNLALLVDRCDVIADYVSLLHKDITEEIQTKMLKWKWALEYDHRFLVRVIKTRIIIGKETETEAPRQEVATHSEVSSVSFLSDLRERRQSETKSAPRTRKPKASEYLRDYVSPGSLPPINFFGDAGSIHRVVKMMIDHLENIKPVTKRSFTMRRNSMALASVIEYPPTHENINSVLGPISHLPYTLSDEEDLEFLSECNRRSREGHRMALLKHYGSEETEINMF